VEKSTNQKYPPFWRGQRLEFGIGKNRVCKLPERMIAEIANSIHGGAYNNWSEEVGKVKRQVKIMSGSGGNWSS